MGAAFSSVGAVEVEAEREGAGSVSGSRFISSFAWSGGAPSSEFAISGAGGERSRKVRKGKRLVPTGGEGRPEDTRGDNKKRDKRRRRETHKPSLDGGEGGEREGTKRRQMREAESKETPL